MEVAEEEGSNHYTGIAKVMTAFALGTLTDIYGDIPWSEAFNTDNETPAYDSQEFIYRITSYNVCYTKLLRRKYA